MSGRVFTVDIGNSRTKTGLVDTSAMRSSRRAVFPTAEALDRVAPLVAPYASAGVPVVLCSVDAALRRALSAVLRERGLSCGWLEFRPSLPVRPCYARPATLGADRLAGLLYCHYRHPGRTAIVISAGTAITMDLLVKGTRHAGGIIMPGITTQLRSLADATAGLPAISAARRAVRFPGRSTRQCISAGVVFGVAAAVNAMAARLSSRLAEPAVVVATGGAWPVIAGLVDFRHRYAVDLTRIGAALSTLSP